MGTKTPVPTCPAIPSGQPHRTRILELLLPDCALHRIDSKRSRFVRWRQVKHTQQNVVSGERSLDQNLRSVHITIVVSRSRPTHFLNHRHRRQNLRHIESKTGHTAVPVVRPATPFIGCGEHRNHPTTERIVGVRRLPQTIPQRTDKAQRCHGRQDGLDQSIHPLRRLTRVDLKHAHDTLAVVTWSFPAPGLVVSCASEPCSESLDRTLQAARRCTLGCPSTRRPSPCRSYRAVDQDSR